MSISSSSKSGTEGAIDIGDIGGEEGGNGEMVRRLSGSSDLESSFETVGESRKPDTDDAVAGLLRSVGEAKP